MNINEKFSSSVLEDIPLCLIDFELKIPTVCRFFIQPTYVANIKTLN